MSLQRKPQAHNMYASEQQIEARLAHIDGPIRRSCMHYTLLVANMRAIVSHGFSFVR